MSTVADVLKAVHRLAPPELAFGFDRIGLQVGDQSARVTAVGVSLDPSHEIISQCKILGITLLISHHPVIWDPLKSLKPDQPVTHLVQSGIASIACHTNWDCAPGGINDVFATKLHLSNILEFGSRSDVSQAKLVLFVPESHGIALLEALTDAGIGTIGGYEGCAFYGKGKGTFIPQTGTNPTVGTILQREFVEELRLEMLLPLDKISFAAETIRRIHPYEEPAFEFHSITGGGGHAVGRIGELAAPLSPADFVQFVDRALTTTCLSWGPPDRPIRKVAVVGGAAADEWRNAMDAGADAFVTGEVPHHVSVMAAEAGLLIVAAGHFATENPGMATFAAKLTDLIDVPVTFLEPMPGKSGRPHRPDMAE